MIRADIAELLHAGVPQIHICRRLHVAPITVQRTREAIGLPAPKPVRVLPATVEDAYRQYVRPTGDGHAEWAGPTTQGSPRVSHDGVTYSAYRIAFRLAQGREPEGQALPACGRRRCVEVGHHEDQRMRAANARADKAFAAIFGRAS